MSTYKITQKELLKKPRTIAKALQDKGVNIEQTCGGRGICGSCKCKNVGGEVHYLREPIALLQKDDVLTCISLPKTNEVFLQLSE